MNQENLQKNIIALLGHLGYTETDITISYDEKAHTVWFVVSGPHTRHLFTRDAEGLAALNHVATKMTEQLMKEEEEENRPRVVIDANGHEKKKIDELRVTAHMMAERARYFKSSVAVEPMPAHERRIMHEFLAEMPDIETESEGMGEMRHIVIKYKEEK
jgi:predicted RNA-binding protein Jag